MSKQWRLKSLQRIFLLIPLSLFLFLCSSFSNFFTVIGIVEGFIITSSRFSNLRQTSTKLNLERYQTVISGLNNLYPPNEVSNRTSISRSDGYWTYLEDGKEPPQHLTYGEFDFLFFAQLLEKSFRILDSNQYNNDHNLISGKHNNIYKGKTIVDIGSGSGRLVIGAAALYPDLKLCKGIEVLPSLHYSALNFLDQCKSQNNNNDKNESNIINSNDIIEQQNNLHDHSTVDDNDEEYDHPMSNEMSNMIGALQGMTAEEWKAILGDYEIDEDDMLFGEENEEDIPEQAENIYHTSDNITNQTCTNSKKNMIENERDLITGIVFASTEDEEQSKNEKEDRIEKFRSLAMELNQNFILPSESELFGDLNDIENDEGDIEFSNDFYFESIEDFLNRPDKDLILMFPGDDKTIYTNETEKHENGIQKDGAHTGLHTDERSEYRLKYQHIDTEEDGSSTVNHSDLLLAPVQFSCASFEDPYEYIGDADIVFVFSTCWTPAMMESLGKCIGRQLKPGSLAITTDFQIPLTGEVDKVDGDPQFRKGKYELELVEKIDGDCSATGGLSTAYIHRVVTSLYEEGVGPRIKPMLPKEELAWRIIQDYESKKLTDTEKFVRNAKNAIAFYSFNFHLDVDNLT